jgi:hypothetical protein
MVNQGRLAKVMITLMAAMTFGAVILLALGGKPIKPMAFSLSSQTQLSPAHSALGTEVVIPPDQWRFIEICYRPNNGRLSSQYGLTGALAIKYHFVIADGQNSQDGQIYASQRWTRQLPSLATSTATDPNQTIRICIIGNPDNPRSTPRQANQLESLVSSLLKHCRTKPRINWED